MNIYKYISGILAGSFLFVSLPALAEHGERHFEGREFHRDGGGWRGDRHTVEVWRGGNWVHERHEGHLGWWWVVAGMWYFYPDPVYPYPDPYTPPVVVVTPQPAAPAPQVVVPAQPQLQYWYYCDALKAYYPYVASCPQEWRAVPAQPPVPTQSVQPPPIVRH